MIPKIATVAAELAPIGVQLWPTTSEDKGMNFTLATVETVRNAHGTFVRWIYENENVRVFKLGERVAVDGEALGEWIARQVCPGCAHELMAPAPKGQPGDDSYYCEGCGQAWSLDLARKVL